MRNLRMQLLFSHLLLVALMLIVMIGGVLSVFHLGRSIDRIMKDNIKSVYAAQNMKEYLERQDSASTFYLAGQVKRAREQYQEYLPRFEREYQIEAHNITESGEGQIAADIGRWYAIYRIQIEKLL